MSLRPRDRAAVIELFASQEVGTYIGGPRPRDEARARGVRGAQAAPRAFVVDLDGAMIGTITLDRRDAERPGHVCPGAGEAELGYMFLPEAWGCGYAAEQWFGVWSPRSRRPDELVRSRFAASGGEVVPGA